MQAMTMNHDTNNNVVELSCGSANKSIILPSRAIWVGLNREKTENTVEAPSDYTHKTNARRPQAF